MAKVLLGLIGNKIVVVDQETTEQAKKDCLDEGCDKVIITEWSSQLYECWTEQTDVNFDWFED
ncbi:MAG: hypothetical protein RSC93_00090 [Erysipelotrichaceae bacterium]